jgi:DNA-binding MarR family transcriptional regulator
MSADHVQDILGQWHRERPDLDVSSMATIGRLHRVSRAIERKLSVSFARFNLQPWSFDVLAALRRSGPPYEMNPTAIVQSLMVSNSAMTNRIDRLEEAKWVERAPAASDRRVTMVRLTETGRQVIDAALELCLAEERRILSVLSPDDQQRLAALLRTLDLSLNP